MGFKTEKELEDYLTRPKRHLDKIIYDSKIKSNTDQRTAPLNKNPNTKVTPKKEIIVPGPLEQLTDKTEKEVMKDPNLLRRIKYAAETYDNIKLGEDFDKAIAQEDKNLAIANGKTILQRYSKEATPQQMENLKNNFNNYKETQKPFTKVQRSNVTTAKNLQRGPVTSTNVPEIPDPRLQKIEKEVQEITKPEPTVEEIIKERAQKRLELEQKEYDQRFGTGGITKLWRPQ